jgi:hypothetical protein
MDDDAEIGIVFIVGLLLGLAAMWLIFTARGRMAAHQVFEAAEDLAEDLAEEAGELLEQATEVADDLRRR